MADSERWNDRHDRPDEHERRKQRRKAPPRPMLGEAMLDSIRSRVGDENAFTGSREQHVEEAIREAGPIGLTDNEGELVTGMAGNSYRPRRRRLEQDGKVVRRGYPRMTQTKRKADVWVHADEAKRQQVEADRRNREPERTD
ncbi:MAG: hypothetical protein AAFS11_04095 [Planctomycetota bacterium]